MGLIIIIIICIAVAPTGPDQNQGPIVLGPVQIEITRMVFALKIII